jgi:hypothetical protein
VEPRGFETLTSSLRIQFFTFAAVSPLCPSA